MCNIYTGTPPDRYDSDCRSIRIQGCVTSIRLENEFWEILDQMAEEESQSVPQFINVLYDEILDTHKDVQNFTSFLRVACAIYLHRKGEVLHTHKLRAVYLNCFSSVREIDK